MKTFTQKSIHLFLVLIICSAVQLSAQSVTDKSTRPFQLSLFPGIGTDGLQTAHNRYQLSINLFAGINGGLNGLELGGFLNINNGMVEGLQFAGFGNVVNGNFQGFQGAGFMNLVNGTSSGINFSGFLNVTSSNQQGIMGAGFLNVINGDSRAILGSGFMNVVRGNFQGIGGAGFMNVAGADMEGIQGAGFMNAVRGDGKGIQGAGFANVVGESMQGTQIAGFMNVARDIQGSQLAGFLNVAREVEGFQLGFINVADTVSGIPIGFLSIVKKGGLRQIEIATSDAMDMSASFKIGVPVFYNIFTIGYKPFHDITFSSTGYGIGTRIKLGHPSYLHLEAHSSQLHHNWKSWEESNNHLSEFRTIYAHSLTPNIQLFAGLTLYNHLYKASSDHTTEELEIATWTMHENSFRDWTSQWWMGARAGLNFVIR